MGTVQSRQQCPECADSGNDNLIVYEEGSGSHCFACGYDEQGTDNYTPSMPKALSRLVDGQCQDIPTRGLVMATCERYGYKVGRYTGYLGKEFLEDELVHIANYVVNNVPIAQKLRNRTKLFTIKGDASKMGLYGQWLYEPNPNTSIIIVEGEIDCLSVSQVMGKNWAVVSVPNGASSACKEIQKQMEYLLGFGTVLLGFDADEAGAKATEQCLALFEPSTVKTIAWPDKDPNNSLVSGKAHDIVEAINNAKGHKPVSIIQANDILDQILTKPSLGISWPWPTMTQATYGIHPKCIYTIGAGSGIGKTEVLLNLMCHLIEKENVPVGAMFLESSPQEIYLRTAGYFLGKRLHIPGAVGWDSEEIKTCINKFNDKLFLYSIDKAGEKGSTWAVVKDKIKYMVKGLGVKHIILDHLTALACHMKDERKELDACMSELGNLVHSLDCTIFLVSHLSKPVDGKGYEEGRIVTANAFRGSQSIQYWSAFMLGLERNKLSENPAERLLTQVRVLKDRFSGEADGLTFYLKYDMITGRLNELRHSDLGDEL